jgi:hypothetical protein
MAVRMGSSISYCKKYLTSKSCQFLQETNIQMKAALSIAVAGASLVALTKLLAIVVAVLLRVTALIVQYRRG